VVELRDDLDGEQRDFSPGDEALTRPAAVPGSVLISELLLHPLWQWPLTRIIEPHTALEVSPVLSRRRGFSGFQAQLSPTAQSLLVRATVAGPADHIRYVRGIDAAANRGVEIGWSGPRRFGI